MATIPKTPLEYKIEKNVPLTRAARFDTESPEYITMLKLKPGESFEFPASRVRNVHNTRNHLQKTHPQMVFSTVGEASIIAKKLKTGRCWRLPDGSARKYSTRKKTK